MLEDMPSSVKTMSVGELLLAQHGWGRKRLMAFLVGTGVQPHRPLGRLTLRQRGVLIEALG